MTDYTQSTTFTTKDSLPTGDASKKILGSEVDAELALISTAIASKANLTSIYENDVFVWAAVNANFDLTAATNTVIRYVDSHTDGVDTGSNWDNTAYSFTAPTDGYYQIVATLYTATQQIEDGSIFRMQLDEDTGGGFVAVLINPTFRVGGNHTPGGLCATFVRKLSSGDKVRVSAYVGAWAAGTGKIHADGSFICVTRVK